MTLFFCFCSIKSGYKDEGTKKVLEDIRHLEHKLETIKKMEQQPRFNKLEEKDIEAIYNDLSTIPNIKQPKIKDDYLETLRIKFLDTRPLKQLLAEQQQRHQLIESTSSLIESNNSNNNTSITTTNDNNDMLTDEFNGFSLKDVTTGDFEQLIYANALAKRPEHAEQSLQLMKENGLTPTIRCYNHLMDAYANTNDVDQVINVYKRINEEGLQPDVFSYSSLVKVLTKDARLDDAFVIFHQMKKLNIIPTQPIFANLISGCLKSQQIDRAWETFDDMRISYHQPDEVTFTLMLHACAKKGEVERALNLFEDMINQQLYPTDVTFNVLINACAKRPDYYNEAFSLLNQMKTIYGFQPDLITYNTLIGACARKKDLARARDIFKHIIMDHDDYDSMTPDTHTFTNMFWCYANYNPSSTKTKTSSSLKEKEIKESTSLIPSSIEAILPFSLPNRRSEVVNEAKGLFQYMMQQKEKEENEKQSSKIKLTTSLLTSYLNVHVTQYQYNDCIQLYESLFSTYQLKPNPSTFTVMLRYCYQLKDTDLAWKIWDEYQAFLETHSLPDYNNNNNNSDHDHFNEMTMIQQKQMKLKLEQQQYKEGWTMDQQRNMVLLMANTLARSNELNYSIQLLKTIARKTKGQEGFKPLKLKEVKTIYDKSIQLENDEAKQEIIRLCSNRSKQSFKPGSFKYSRINV
ncbi:unnamed protein product [Cunninghamella blakesleeana]